MANYSISPSFLPMFTISITFPMQMNFNSPKFFLPTSYSPYSPNFFTAKVFYCTVCNKLVNECSTQKYNYSRLYSNHIVMKKSQFILPLQFFQKPVIVNRHLFIFLVSMSQVRCNWLNYSIAI